MKDPSRASGLPEGPAEPLKVEGHRPRRRFGQNFLTDPGIQRRIAEALGGEASDPVLEIGPGKGALTRFLAERGGPLILVEVDRNLAAAHRAHFVDRPSVQVFESDILKLPLTDILSDPSTLRVIGNIPYNITTPILFHLLSRPRPAEIVLMVQREVADRITAMPGNAAYGALSVGVQTVAQVEPVLTVPAGAFFPRPKVDSAVIRLRPFFPAPLSLEEEGQLRTLTRALFQWRRKQIGKTLRDHPDLRVPEAAVLPVLEGCGVAPQSRPETLAPSVFIDLARALARQSE
jgi:16S rRNA (adenine1518-N6/adenine1519-N6)-dimethyltransferase